MSLSAPGAARPSRHYLGQLLACLSEKPSEKEKKVAYEIFQAWKQAQVVFPEGDVIAAESAFDLEFTQSYGIHLFNAKSAGEIYFIMELLRLLPEHVLRSGVIQRVNLSASRDQNARFAQYNAENKGVEVIDNPIKFDRYLLTTFLLHELGHAVWASLDDQQKDEMQQLHGKFVEADAIFGVDFMGIRKEERLDYMRKSSEEFFAENFMHYLVLGTSGMLGAKDSNAHLRARLAEFYASLYKPQGPQPGIPVVFFEGEALVPETDGTYRFDLAKGAAELVIDPKKRQAYAFADFNLSKCSI